MTTREIVTLQIGHYSNFVGAHMWNIQDSTFQYEPSPDAVPREINHDIFFREGQNPMGHLTYTPRLVIFDLKGSLKSLKQEGILYDATNQEEDIKWSGDVTMHKAALPFKNRFLQDLQQQEELEEIGDTKVDSIEDVEVKDSDPMTVEERGTRPIFGSTTYYNLDDSVSVWSDFLRLHLHPKSIYLLDKYTHGSDMETFDVFGCGQQLLQDYTTRTEVEDRLHYFIEECDQLQGFQVMLDTCDGFGGFSSKILQTLTDEYSSKGLFSVGLTPALLPDSTIYNRADRIINSALSYVSCATSSSLFLPISAARELWKKMGPVQDFDHLHYQSIHYHSSSVLAAALDSMTMPFRRQDLPLHIRDITNTLGALGRKVACLQACLPFQLEIDESLVDAIIKMGDKVWWKPLTPHMKNKFTPTLQSVVMSGIPTNQIRSELRSCENYMSSCSTVDEVLQAYLTEKFPTTMNAGCVMKDALRVVSPFPHIFSKNISTDGFLSAQSRHQYQGVERVPVVTALQSNPDVVQLLTHLHTESSKLNIKRHHRFLEAGLEEDDYKETLDNLSALSQQYNHESDL